MLTILILVISVVVLPIGLVLIALVNPSPRGLRAPRPAAGAQRLPDRIASAAAASAACRPEGAATSVCLKTPAVSKR